MFFEKKLVRKIQKKSENLDISKTRRIWEVIFLHKKADI